MSEDSIFDRVIQADEDPTRPKPMSWVEYEPQVTMDWSSALEGNEERALQSCIEKHPCLLAVDSVQTATFPGGHHGVWMDAIITQPPLSGFHRRVPDFMWLTSDSSTVVATCVEIERQGKLWFNRDGTPTADLNQARDQIDEWRIWFKSASPDEFFEAYRLPDSWRKRNFSQRFVLLYGRRSEFDDRAGSRHGNEAHRLNRKRSELFKPDTANRTLDAIRPAESSKELVTIQNRDHQLIAVNVPPTFTTGPHMRDLARNVEGLAEAIERLDPDLSRERIEYLVGRVGFWRAAPEYGAFGHGDE